ncbi:MAG: hypothetical protein WC368_06030, partial [Candidatus Cloacimonadaceae bacterium]
MEIQAMSGIRFFHPKNSPCSSLGPRTPALIYGERIALYLVSFTPKTHDVPFWGPRSFYPKNSPCSSLGPRTPALI